MCAADAPAAAEDGAEAAPTGGRAVAGLADGCAAVVGADPGCARFSGMDAACKEVIVAGVAASIPTVAAGVAVMTMGAAGADAGAPACPELAGVVTWAPAADGGEFAVVVDAGVLSAAEAAASPA